MDLELLELIDRLGMPAIVLVALALAGRAMWRFLVERAYPEWIELQQARLNEQKKTRAKIELTLAELGVVRARLEELWWACIKKDEGGPSIEREPS